MAGVGWKEEECGVEWTEVEKVEAAEGGPVAFEATRMWEPEEECERLVRFLEEDLPSGKEQMRCLKKSRAAIVQAEQRELKRRAELFQQRSSQHRVLQLWSLSRKLTHLEKRAGQPGLRAVFQLWASLALDEGTRQEVKIQALQRQVEQQERSTQRAALLGAAATAGALALAAVAVAGVRRAGEGNKRQEEARKELEQRLDTEGSERSREREKLSAFGSELQSQKRELARLDREGGERDRRQSADLRRLERAMGRQDREQSAAREQATQHLETKLRKQDARQAEAREEELQRLQADGAQRADRQARDLREGLLRVEKAASRQEDRWRREAKEADGRQNKALNLERQAREQVLQEVRGLRGQINSNIVRPLNGDHQVRGRLWNGIVSLRLSRL